MFIKFSRCLSYAFYAHCIIMINGIIFYDASWIVIIVMFLYGIYILMHCFEFLIKLMFKWIINLFKNYWMPTFQT